MIISESKGNLATLLCEGFCLFMQDSGGGGGEGGGGGVVDYSCLNCQDVKKELSES